MKNIIVGAYILCFFYGQVVMAQSTADISWSSNTVYVKANTPRTPQLTCNYAFTVYFSDGKNASFSGKTDPGTGGTNLTAVSQRFNKIVSRADLNRWACGPKR